VNRGSFRFAMLVAVLLTLAAPGVALAQPAYNLDGTWWVAYDDCGSTIFDGAQYIVSGWSPTSGAFNYYETPQDQTGTGSESGTSVTINGSQVSVSGPVASNGQALVMTLTLGGTTTSCGQPPTYTFVNVCPEGNVTPIGTPAPAGTSPTDAMSTATASLQPNPITDDPVNGGTLSTTATVTAQTYLQAACVDLDLTPSDDLSDPAQFATADAARADSADISPFASPLDSFGDTDATINEPLPEVSGQVYVAAPGQTTLALNGFKIAPGQVVKNGFTLSGLNKWSLKQDPDKAGWLGTSPGNVTLGEDHLVYSDRPEYLDDGTQVITDKGLVAGGNDVEGVLYRETGGTYATGKSSDFRVYLNHENRTDRGKSICVVISNPATKGRVTVNELYSGQSSNAADPVKAGQQALQDWESSRHSPHPSSEVVAGGDAWARCLPSEPGGNPFETLAPASSYTTKGPGGKSVTIPVHRVINAILDFSASGRVQAGVVVINSGKDRVMKFEKEPLQFEFEGGPKDAKRTYEDAGQLENAGEASGHVRGTFPYDTVSVTIGSFIGPVGKFQYNLDAAVRYGVRIVSRAEDPREYAPALDTGTYNDGNYGVLYTVSIPAVGLAGEQDQVLINPRGIGPVYNDDGDYLGYTNGYDGVVDAPGPLGPEIPIPNLTDPNLANQTNLDCPTVAPSTNLICTDLGVGIGLAKANQTFTFAFMPPGGAALPVAVVLNPAFIKVTPTLAYDDPRTNDLVVKGTPVIFPFAPA